MSTLAPRSAAEPMEFLGSTAGDDRAASDVRRTDRRSGVRNRRARHRARSAACVPTPCQDLTHQPASCRLRELRRDTRTRDRHSGCSPHQRRSRVHILDRVSVDRGSDVRAERRLRVGLDGVETTASAPYARRRRSHDLSINAARGAEGRSRRSLPHAGRPESAYRVPGRRRPARSWKR